MKKIEVNHQSLLATKQLLLDIIGSPSEFTSNKSLQKAMKSQGGIAKYEDIDRGIAPCSLNTLKVCAERLLERGFMELDEVRKNALLALEQVEQKNHGANLKTRVGLTKMVDQLKNDNDILRQRNHLLSLLVMSMKNDLKRFVEQSDDPKLLIDYKERNKKIEAMLSYTQDGAFE